MRDDFFRRKFLKQLEKDFAAPDDDEHTQQQKGCFAGHFASQPGGQRCCQQAADDERHNGLPVRYTNHDEKREGAAERNEKLGEADGADDKAGRTTTVDQRAGNNGAPATAAKRIEKTASACQ